MIKELEINLNIMPYEYGVCFFGKEFEDDENILFHITDIENLKSINENGFKSRAELTGLPASSNNLDSISFATKSSGCVERVQSKFNPEKIIIIVDYSEIKNNADVSYICFPQSDEKKTIYIKNSVSQLKIIGYVRVPMDDEFYKKVIFTALED